MRNLSYGSDHGDGGRVPGILGHNSVPTEPRVHLGPAEPRWPSPLERASPSEEYRLY